MILLIKVMHCWVHYPMLRLTQNATEIMFSPLQTRLEAVMLKDEKYDKTNKNFSGLWKHYIK